MITADNLARELGCTLSDLEDLTGQKFDPTGYHTQVYTRPYADELRAEWSRRTGIDYTDNQLIRVTTLDHRVKSVRPGTMTGITILDCQCGHVLRSHSADPEIALRRLWKSHALHVSAALMLIGSAQ